MIGSEQTGADNEVWSFGDEQYGIIRRLLFLRERLRPYVMAQMRKASESGLPPMRPLFVDFPADSASWDVEDQFLLVGEFRADPGAIRDFRDPAGQGRLTPGRRTVARPGGEHPPGRAAWRR